MQAFSGLFERLDQATGTTSRLELLRQHFAAAEPADAAWALHCLLGKQRRRLISGRRLRQICLEHLGLPEWLFEACYSQVGDSAETIALLLGGGDPANGPDRASNRDSPPLHVWMERLLPQAAALSGDEQAQAVLALWAGLNAQELLVLNKLLTGGFRVGVGPGLVLRALAQLSGLEEAQLAHRLMGRWTASAEAYRALLQPGDDDAVPSRPYPFFLASPLEPGQLSDTPASDWLVEWKWDGIRGQMIRRAGQSFLWSRGEELIHAAFPELLDLADLLPDGTVLDGELLIWPPQAERPQPFAMLQRRLGRKAPGRARLAECPAAFVAYDLLERGGDDLRPTPLSQRRAALEALHQHLQQAAPTAAAGRLRLSSLLPLSAWTELDALRDQARAVGAEGLMLKHAESAYQVGRRRGHWWKHKLEPLRLDAVLLYAQAGSGRRANLFTDYTFGLWETAPRDGSDGSAAMATVLEATQRSHVETGADPSAPRLVSFAKAYSGLNDQEIAELDRWIRSHTTERFGPVRAVQPLLVFELAFEGIQPSSRHKSGIAVRFPRIARWRRDKPAHEADCLASAQALLLGAE
ncbi:MAG: cisplatin damage response ATP-dependent DNA ligase [Synechococcaceae cyanobacterium]|nr:cisplatin damage response ATP-dependent DNA ligase [Synechococcaceae cyanobacterium]